MTVIDNARYIVRRNIHMLNWNELEKVVQSLWGIQIVEVCRIRRVLACAAVSRISQTRPIVWAEILIQMNIVTGNARIPERFYEYVNM